MSSFPLRIHSPVIFIVNLLALYPDWRFIPLRPSFKFRLLLALCCGTLLCSSAALAASAPGLPSLPDAPASHLDQHSAVTIRNAPVQVLHQQAAIWTSPARMTRRDLLWLGPLAVATGVGIATDHHTMSSVVSRDPTFNQDNVNVSNALIGGMIAAPVAFYGWGHFEGDTHARETGILGAEALVDGVVVEQGMKLVFWRERPALHNARGHFFEGDAGVDGSFPSSHAVLAWSSAAVIAGEYHNPWAQVGVYSAASAISLTRVLGQQHFPTDVLVGSSVGWLIGHYVYKHFHRYNSPRLR
ncbi:PAP2 domain protein [Acidobacterium capsulatum ATCC 51196]|uniref:PAP2 domain protein n=1 Tax=Acidobacterium capsulatum (strain ATCC 51196 / DSM 11244 / BCRC 80197 / JCM 7670 / NBRC 15755 / NCIMB 13165 / 161) TaxID=240015 RepID=C1F3B1_ACIC5|nr:PAP2 domain protein [Acidobacterium capsulatum ATCC 51196]